MASPDSEKTENKSPSEIAPFGHWRDPFQNFHEDFGSMMERAFGRSLDVFDNMSFGRLGMGILSPNVDVRETDNEITLTAELPGLDEKDVEVIVENRTLTIRGTKREEKEQGEGKARLIERRYGSFARSFTLPPHVDEAKIKAQFEKGLLRLSMPKSQNAKPSGRRIEITKA